MIYLLDTNTCIQYINRQFASLSAHHVVFSRRHSYRDIAKFALLLVLKQ